MCTAAICICWNVFFKLAGHVTKLSKISNWLVTFVLLSAINFIGWRVYKSLASSLGRICFQANDKGELSLSHKQGNLSKGHILYMHLGKYLMNLHRVKYFPSSWDRKAVSPRSGFSAISCVTHNCAQQMFTRNKSRCIKSRLLLTVAPSMETRLLSEIWGIILSGRVEISSNYL